VRFLFTFFTLLVLAVMVLRLLPLVRATGNTWARVEPLLKSIMAGNRPDLLTVWRDRILLTS
jgi:hypothetical protein